MAYVTTASFALALIAAFLIKTSTQQTCDPNCKPSIGCTGFGEGKCDGECNPGFTFVTPGSPLSIGSNDYTCVGGTTEAVTTTSRSAATAAAQNTATTSSQQNQLTQSGTGLTTGNAQQNTAASGSNTTGPNASNTTGTTGAANAASTTKMPLSPAQVTLSTDQVVIISVLPSVLAGAFLFCSCILIYFLGKRRSKKDNPQNAISSALVGSAPPSRTQTGHVTASEYWSTQPPLTRVAPASGAGYGFYEPGARRFWR